MEPRWGFLVGILLIGAVVGAELAPVLKAGETPASALEAVSDTLDMLKQRMGWNADEVKLGSIDTRDAKIGQTLIYEFDIQVNSVVIPLRLSEEVTTWQYLQELPAAGSVRKGGEYEVNEGAVNVWRPEAFAATTLSPFEVAGPVDLWIQDAEELRLSMPHDVDAGVLKRVLLSDGAVVSVQGAREVSLSRPLQLPLPLVRGSEGGLAASLVALAARLRAASRGEEKPLLSLRIVSPTSLTAVKLPEEATSGGGRLKVKRLGSGAIEVTSPVAKNTDYTVPFGSLALTENIEDLYMWPLPTINKTKLEGLEEALIKTLGSEAYKRGSFQLLNAKVSAASFVQIEFEVEKAVDKKALAEVEELWPEWATKPDVERLQFELLTKVEGRKLVPVRVQQSEPVLTTISISSDLVMGNSTMKAPIILMPPGAMTLDVDLDGIFD